MSPARKRAGEKDVGGKLSRKSVRLERFFQHAPTRRNEGCGMRGWIMMD